MSTLYKFKIVVIKDPSDKLGYYINGNKVTNWIIEKINAFYQKSNTFDATITIRGGITRTLKRIYGKKLVHNSDLYDIRMITAQNRRLREFLYIFIQDMIRQQTATGNVEVKE